MNNPWNVIQELEADNSRLAKEAIVAREAKAENDMFFKGVNMALSSFITFGVKKVPVSEVDGNGLDFETFNVLADRLLNRFLTGHDARDAIEDAMNQATTEQWNDWYRRILIKDLRCGVNNTINRVVKKFNQNYLIEVFECMLAQPNEKFPKLMIGEKMLEVKLDGARVLTIVNPLEKSVRQFTRNGKELFNFPDSIKDIETNMDWFGDRPFVLDGEIMSSSFQDLMKQIKRKSDVETSDAVLNLFDIVPLDEFKKGKSTKNQLERTADLQKFYKERSLTMTNVNVIEHEIVNLSTKEGYARFMEVNKLALKMGYEGLMIKDPYAIYECKRSSAWLKIKPFIEVTLKVVGVEEGTGKNVGRLGNLICAGVDDGVSIKVSVGGGFSDNQRKEFWDMRDEALDQLVEIRADAVTQSQDQEDTFSLRFPRFLRFRGFEKGEKI